MVTVKPAGTALSAQTANQLSLTVSFLEQYKKPRNCKSQTPIQTTVSYSTGTSSLAGTSLFVPVIATVTAVYLLCNGGTKSKTFVEVFDIAFQGQSSLTSTSTITSLGKSSSTSTSCCGVTNLSIDDSISITIS